MSGALFLALAVAAAVGSEPVRDPGEELKSLRQQAAELEQRLRTLAGMQQAKDRERQVLEAQLALETVRVRESEATLQQLKEREGEAARQAEATRREYAAALEQLERQLGVLAVLGRPGLAPMLLHAVGSGADVRERVTTVLAIVKHHEAERQVLARLMEARTAALAELSRRRAEADEAARELALRRRTLEETRRRLLAELAALEGERRQGAVALAATREAEARLERLWGVVAGGAEAASVDPRFLRGGLPWPVEGVRIVRPFGARRDPRYGTVTVSHGMDLEAAPGQRVKAVAHGTVIYAQFFKGYGNVVIVDHGQGVYSLYGRLASILTRTGARLTMGEPVGLTGRREPGEGNLYLEIRVGDKPQNPVAWLRPLGKRGVA